MELKDYGFLIGAGVAIIGWLVTRHNALQFSKRKERLELINKRLNDFYGPLYVATRAGRASYERMVAQLGINEAAFFGNSALSEANLREFHHWMKNVLVPLNDVIEKAVLENAYLIIEEQMPQPITDYMEHVSTVRVTVAHWDSGNFSQKSLPMRYPEELDEYIKRAYSRLKSEQLKLLGMN